MAEAVNHQLLTAGHGFHPRPVIVGCVAHCGTEMSFPLITSFFPSHCHSTTVPKSYIVFSTVIFSTDIVGK